MDKQELINHIEEVKGDKPHYREQYHLGRWQTYENVLEIVDQLDEPEITEEQAWEVIAEIHNQDKTYWQDAKNHYVRSLNKPKQTEVPQFVADWIESHSNVSWWKTIALWENEVPEEDKKVYEWYENYNEKDFINAWLNGNYIIKKEPCWTVERENGDYVEWFDDSLYELNVRVTSSLDVVSPHRFTDEAKAKAVALLVGGTVRELPEDEAMKLIEGWKEDE